MFGARGQSVLNGSLRQLYNVCVYGAGSLRQLLTCARYGGIPWFSFPGRKISLILSSAILKEKSYEPKVVSFSEEHFSCDVNLPQKLLAHSAIVGFTRPNIHCIRMSTSPGGIYCKCDVKRHSFMFFFVLHKINITQNYIYK